MKGGNYKATRIEHNKLVLSCRNQLCDYCILWRACAILMGSFERRRKWKSTFPEFREPLFSNCGSWCHKKRTLPGMSQRLEVQGYKRWLQDLYSYIANSHWKGDHLPDLHHYIIDVPSAASIYQGMPRTPPVRLCFKTPLFSVFPSPIRYAVKVDWRQFILFGAKPSTGSLVLLIIRCCIDLHFVVIIFIIIIPRISAIILLLLFVLTQSRYAPPRHVIILNPSSALW